MNQISPLYSPTSVLIVEDNMDTADSIARFLRIGAGYYVRVAYDGATAVRLAVNDPPAAVVCDISLPKLDGLEVAERLLAQLDEKPLLIAVTAFSGNYPEARALASGFDHYLTKPADPFRIESLIRIHVEGSRPG